MRGKQRPHPIRQGFVMACLLPLFGAEIRGEDVQPGPSMQPCAAAIRKQIRAAMRQNEIPALSIAVVDSTGILWSEGFSDPRASNPDSINSDSIFRVGSVSKLLTDMAIMQAVETGQLDLDKPVNTYLPDFQPRNSFDRPITLRMLMAHRSGLVRESPVGNYFDGTEPGLEATVSSLNKTRLVYEPGLRTKYSNAGIAVVGKVLEAVHHAEFESLLVKQLLQPLGMSSSSFDRQSSLAGRYVDGLMWTLDGREFVAPEFKLGTAPAGNLYSSANDLGQLIRFLLQRDQSSSTRILSMDSLREMWSPQLATREFPSSYGLGFHLDRLGQRRRLGHGGAIYGFSTELALLPDDDVGVVVVSARDLTNGIVRDIANQVLRSTLALRQNETMPEWDEAHALPEGLARTLEGRFRSDSGDIVLVARGDRLFLRRGTFRREVRIRGDRLILDDCFGRGSEIQRLSTDRLLHDKQEWNRIEDPVPDEAPQAWQGLIGEYGWDHNTLYILEDEGRLYALIEWLFRYPLTELETDRFAFPSYGMYHGEELIFERDASGRATRVVAASVDFPRRNVGPVAGETFRIKPLLPIDTLRQNALKATPPEEDGPFRDADLVEVNQLDPTIRLDVRYATSNNFMGEVFYRQPRAFLQKPAAEAVVRAHRKLSEYGYGLLIHDAYRPWFVTHMFHEATPQSMRDFVANPANGSRHNRGCAVDLTLYELDSGQPVEMVAGYDEFSPRSFPDYPGGTARQRWLRELLRDAMSGEGFTIYELEWWHFDYQSWRQYGIGNQTFEELLR